MERELTFGQVVEGTLELVQRNWPPVLLYLASMTVVGALLEWGTVHFLDDASGLFEQFAMVQAMFGIGAGIAGLAIFVLAIVAQYMMWEALMRREALGENFARHRYLAFFGQMILLSLGIGLGYLFLIVPGIIFAARWSMAPALLVGNDAGVIEGMQKSWDAVSGQTTPVALAYLVGAVFVTLLAGGTGYASAWEEGGIYFNLFSIALGQLANNVGAVLAIALGVFMFDRFFGSQTKVGKVFA